MSLSIRTNKKERDLIKRLERIEAQLQKVTKNLRSTTSDTTFVAGTNPTPADIKHENIRAVGLNQHHPQSHALQHDVAGFDALDISKFFLGNFEEQFDFVVTSDGAVITGSLEKTGEGDLISQWSDGHAILDCTPAKTITITAGTDEVPVLRFYYILQSSKDTIVEGSEWPSAEHIQIATINVPSAAFIQTKNVYSNQNRNNMLSFVAGDLSGMLRHLVDKIRESIGATYIFDGGLAGNAGGGEYLDVSGGTTVRFKMTAGNVMQMHKHAFNAVDTSSGDQVLVRNFSGTAWNDISNLYDIENDSVGGTINNRFFELVFIGLANKEKDYVYVNTPGGSYNNLTQAQSDLSQFRDFTVPSEFKAVATLICSMIVKKAASAWVVHQITDYRGESPAIISGSILVGGYSDSDTERVIDAELVNGQSIDNAIDTLIATHAGAGDPHGDRAYSDIASLVGVANRAYVPTIFETSSKSFNDANIGINSLNGFLAFTTSFNQHLIFQLPLPTILNGLKLYIDAFKVGVQDADADDYVNAITAYGLLETGITSLATEATDRTAAGSHETTFTAVDCSSYDSVELLMLVFLTDVGDLDITGIQIRCYYDV